MELQGSCHCGAVKFSCLSKHPYPYQPCYCGVCRKTAGAGGFAINLAASWKSLNVEGESNISIYKAVLKRGEDGVPLQVSLAKRHFCKICGSQLWLYDERWPELVHPHASAIDTELPIPPERCHIMIASKASWVVPQVNVEDKQFDEYPKESIEVWHQHLHLEK